jgi:hypothetical protein
MQIEDLRGKTVLVDGKRQFISVDKYTTGKQVRVMLYSVGRDVLTINLGPEDLREPYELKNNEVFVKCSTLMWLVKHLAACGFEATGKEVGYGPHDAKAAVYVFTGKIPEEVKSGGGT